MTRVQELTTLTAARTIVEDVIWATATTVSASGTPRSRLVHPIWPDGPTSSDFAVLRVDAYRVLVRQGVDKLEPWRAPIDLATS